MINCSITDLNGTCRKIHNKEQAYRWLQTNHSKQINARKNAEKRRRTFGDLFVCRKMSLFRGAASNIRIAKMMSNLQKKEEKDLLFIYLFVGFVDFPSESKVELSK